MSHIQHFISFIEETEKSNTAKVGKHALKDIEVDISNFTTEELENLILNLHPKSKRQIITTCQWLKKYAKWLFEQNIVTDDTLYQNIQKLDKNKLWNDAKPNAEKKFISYIQYKDILQKISIEEEYNPLYYEALFTSIFEGIYCDDMSVLHNLRGSDICGTIVTLHEDNGNTYQLRVSEKLAAQLSKLASMYTRKRRNAHSVFEVETIGKFPDSVFKVEKRTTNSNNYNQFPYYDKLSKIQSSYVGYTLQPKHLYASGLVHRMQYRLETVDISLEEAFSENCRNKTAHQIIVSELERCNNVFEIGNFRELMTGHIGTFANDTTDDISDDLFDIIVPYQPVTEYLEGAALLTNHKTHERNSDIVTLAKNLFKERHAGRLFCEKCEFDFSMKYGERGVDFIEAHHINPIAERAGNEATKIEDLVMLCSNCHSIVHRTQPWLTMNELESILRSRT